MVRVQCALLMVQHVFCWCMCRMIFVGACGARFLCRLEGPLLRSTVWLTIPPRHPPSKNRQNAYIQIAGDAAASKEITTQLAVVANTTCSTNRSHNHDMHHTSFTSRAGSAH